MSRHQPNPKSDLPEAVMTEMLLSSDQRRQSHIWRTPQLVVAGYERGGMTTIHRALLQLVEPLRLPRHGSNRNRVE